MIFSTSCSSNRESRVFCEDVIRSEYATFTLLSESQNEDLIGSCNQYHMATNQICLYIQNQRR